MNSKATERFWKCFAELPTGIKKKAKEAYKEFRLDPYYPGLHFKRVHSTRPIFSARITKDYRAVGILQGDDIIWFWIGSHTGYDKLLNQLRKV